MIVIDPVIGIKLVNAGSFVSKNKLFTFTSKGLVKVILACSTSSIHPGPPRLGINVAIGDRFSFEVVEVRRQMLTDIRIRRYGGKICE